MLKLAMAMDWRLKESNTSHIAHRAIIFSLKHKTTTVISGGSPTRFIACPAADHALKHCVQVHVYTEKTRTQSLRNLTKHSQFAQKQTQEERQDKPILSVTLALSFFFDEPEK